MGDGGAWDQDRAIAMLKAAADMGDKDAMDLLVQNSSYVASRKNTGPGKDAVMLDMEAMQKLGSDVASMARGEMSNGSTASVEELASGGMTPHSQGMTTAQIDQLVDRITKITGNKFTNLGLGSLSLGVTRSDITKMGFKVRDPDILISYYRAERFDNVKRRREYYKLGFDDRDCVEIIASVDEFTYLSSDFFVESFGSTPKDNIFDRGGNSFSARYFFPQTSVIVLSSEQVRGGRISPLLSWFSL